MSKNNEAKKVFGITIGKPKVSVNSLLVVTAEERQNVVFSPKLPIVNVIPFGIVEKYQVKGIVRKFGLAAIGIIAVFGLGSLGVLGYLSSQQSEIDNLAAEQQRLTMESTALAPYQAYNFSVNDKRKILKTVTTEDVNMGAIYENINNASANSTITITTLGIAQNKAGEDASSCTNPDPFSSVVLPVKIIGCVVLEGSGDSKDQVNAFLSELESTGGDTPAYVNPFISTFSTVSDPAADGRASSFSATIAFTSALYTNKYSSLSLELNELITNVATTTTAQDSEATSAPQGITAIFAGTLIDSLTDSDSQNIDNIAYASCTSGDTTTTQSDLTTLLETNYPNIEPSAIVEQIMSEISDNCDAIVAEKEGN